MTKKDCFFSIVIIMMIEYFVFDWTSRFGADSNLTDHISFAGTIIGIILAVVAIFYSFVQAESQSRSSTEIAAQIGSLRDVVKEIDLSKVKFSDELDRMSDIAKRLDTLDSHVGQSNNVLSSMQSDVMRLMSQLESFKNQESQPVPVGGGEGSNSGDDQIIQKLVTASLDTLLFSYCLKLSLGKQYVENDLLFEHFSMPTADLAKAEAEPEKGMEEWKSTFSRKAASAIQIMRILRSFGLVEISAGEEKVTIAGKFEEALKSFDFDTRLSSKYTEQLRNAIAASFLN